MQPLPQATSVAVIPPVPIAVSAPAFDIWTPFAVPPAVIVIGFIVLVRIVWTTTGEPLPVLPVKSLNVNGFAVDQLPAASQVVVSVAPSKEKSFEAVGFVIVSQATVPPLVSRSVMLPF